MRTCEKPAAFWVAEEKASLAAAAAVSGPLAAGVNPCLFRIPGHRICWAEITKLAITKRRCLQ